MRVARAVDHFGSKAKVARALGINRSLVTRWGEVVPLRHAWKLRTKSKYKLAMRLSDYR